MKLMEICFGDCVPTRGAVRMMQGGRRKMARGFDFATVAVQEDSRPGPLASPDPRQAQSGRFWIGRV